MKVFALYLPQFHEIPENNEWWGKGFTEWTNVRKAKPLFKGHVQPLIPLDNRYYDLRDKETVAWQTEIMKSYGISGMIYYHYYFKGKKLLEEPAENLLKWTDIDQPFFFCWANHSWNRAWKGSREVLLEQTYGNQADWRAHFEYLLPFFQDARYEKKDNKPLFMIYDTSFSEKNEMLECFNTWCIESGFDGIYPIELCMTVKGNAFAAFSENMSPLSEKCFLSEPSVGRLLTYPVDSFFARVMKKLKTVLRAKGILRTVQILSGNKIYQTMIDKEPHGENIIRGMFFGWDNTPRHSFRGYIITPPSKEIFMQYAQTIKDDEYVFVNAWNEWAEGMILEPTQQNGYQYLEWINEWIKSCH
ncbi:MAG: glycoside hydrolase family 99-like domain-containing protein [Oscillospiraceae bacterium]|nr:glycoside hydrolase family 99-like domain-containing protein [Oscillospiraceae bacterium]